MLHIVPNSNTQAPSFIYTSISSVPQPYQPLKTAAPRLLWTIFYTGKYSRRDDDKKREKKASRVNLDTIFPPLELTPLGDHPLSHPTEPHHLIPRGALLLSVCVVIVVWVSLLAWIDYYYFIIIVCDDTWIIDVLMGFDKFTWKTGVGSILCGDAGCFTYEIVCFTNFQIPNCHSKAIFSVPFFCQVDFNGLCSIWGANISLFLVNQRSTE